MSKALKYLDALVDEEGGFKTEVTVTLTQKTLTDLALYLIGTVVVSSIAFFAIRALANWRS